MSTRWSRWEYRIWIESVLRLQLLDDLPKQNLVCNSLHMIEACVPKFNTTCVLIKKKKILLVFILEVLSNLEKNLQRYYLVLPAICSFFFFFMETNCLFLIALF